jgi:hypothetical protein
VNRRTAWSAAELLATTFPEPRWAVPGIIPEGLTLLCGAPKLGKSWLGLNLGVSVALGGVALGRVPVEEGDVVYLALEDTPRRLQTRLISMLQGTEAPGRLLIATEWPTLDEGGAEQLMTTLAARSDTRLVMVDVLARIRSRGDRGETLYERDYRTVAALKAVADAHSVALVVITHVRKAAAEDFLDTVSGTNGLAGAADTIAILRRARGKHDAELKITGRDVEEAEHALTFDPAIGTWTLLTGAVTDYRLHDTRRAILEAVRDRSPMTPKQIADATGIEYETAKKTALRMAKDGQLHADSAGRYAPVSLSLVSLESLSLASRDTRDSRDWDTGEEELPLDPEEPA